ncbi:MAG: hypothetical protein ACE5KM_09560 [Planctomycetaceae bacterium]
MSQPARSIVAFGPRMPSFGSWQWIGEDLIEELSDSFQTVSFDDEIPPCDVAVFVKFQPPVDVLRQVKANTALLYCPVDYYGDARDVDADGGALWQFDRIVIHCERLRKYFNSYSRVEYVDHHLKYVADAAREPAGDAPILWVGVRTNLPPLVEWLRANRLPGPLLVLTNPEETDRVPAPREYGFPADSDVTIERWSPERHLKAVRTSRAALDVKDCDFRSRHKPPAKALDFLASGLPLAMNGESSPAEHLRRLGFELAEPTDGDRWLSHEYREETRQFGAGLRETHSRESVGQAWAGILETVLKERTPRTAGGAHAV